jgi:hypothetical protein
MDTKKLRSNNNDISVRSFILSGAPTVSRCALHRIENYVVFTVIWNVAESQF